MTHANDGRVERCDAARGTASMPLRSPTDPPYGGRARRNERELPAAADRSVRPLWRIGLPPVHARRYVTAEGPRGANRTRL